MFVLSFNFNLRPRRDFGESFLLHYVSEGDEGPDQLVQMERSTKNKT